LNVAAPVAALSAVTVSSPPSVEDVIVFPTLSVPRAGKAKVDAATLLGSSQSIVTV
jgi:hypothetical protein